MDELYKVGEKVAQDHDGLMGGANAAAIAEAFRNDPALAELMGGGADIEQYLENYGEMLTQGLGPQLNVVDAEGGILVRPEPGFVIKTRDVNSGMKIFLNVVSNEHVEKPHMKSLEELQGEEGCRVPLSVGSPVEDFDKKNEACVSYDLVANPDIVNECLQTPAFKESVISLCLAAIAQKYKIELDPRYKLPKIQYKGSSMQFQRIRVSKQSQIQEMASKASAAPLPGEATARRAKSAITSGYTTASTDGPPTPDFHLFYSKANAVPIDGFDHKWGLPPNDVDEALELDHVFGLDMPCYRINAFNENVRGSMMNQSQKEGREAESERAAHMTWKILAERTCFVHIKLDKLDRHTASLKQFNIEVSDECLRINFPLLPRSNATAYAPLTLWWPRHFCSAQAVAEWETQSDTLVVSLPTESPGEDSVFDTDLLNAVF